MHLVIPRIDSDLVDLFEGVANGNLSTEMPLKIRGHALKGEFLRIAKDVNYMVKQLNLFSREVTRVARERVRDNQLNPIEKI